SGATSAAARCGVRSAAGRSNSRSSTACTSVPRAWSALGCSGSRSMVRNRNSSGQVLKSAAREGDSDGRPGSCAASSAGSRTSSAANPPTAKPSTVIPDRLGQPPDETPPVEPARGPPVASSHEPPGRQTQPDRHREPSHPQGDRTVTVPYPPTIMPDAGGGD